ncbi:MAG: sigma-54-dependent Fis family transcriptional regulator [Candidatus Lambdaproteobacteria bacterium]|nr:sigma-54-dependent Fis family transcriptional regulator [Candidatus Lambdaproteobacteria bacterium]
MKVLIVDDNEVTRRQLFWALRKDHDLIEAPSLDEAPAFVAQHAPDVVLTELQDEGARDESKGLALVHALLQDRAAPFIIIITRSDRKDVAAELLEQGVFDYFVKPVPTDELAVVLKRAERWRELSRGTRQSLSGARAAREAEAAVPGGAMPDWAQELGIIAVDPQMKHILELVKRIAPTPVSVLITGETGTGKEVFAQAVHALSDRKNQRFVPLNCAVLSDNLVEDELFGHEKGAFTGAISQRKGKFEFADGGSLFLDEIGDLGEGLQAKFLRVLQEKQFERLGGNQTIATDFRLIAATHQDLGELVRSGDFREDLMFRVNVFSFNLPPLRERRGDIKLLATHFLEHYAASFHRPGGLRFSRELVRFLHDYHWPGNVRELQHFVERAVALSEGNQIGVEVMPDSLRVRDAGNGRASVGAGSFESLVRDYKLKLVHEALEMTGHNKNLTAKVLGISRSYLFKLLKQTADAPEGPVRRSS